MQSSTLAKQDNTSEGTDKAEIEAVENVISKLVLAVKQTNLYPENHAVSRGAIEELSRTLGVFIAQYGDLVLEVLGEGFRYQEHFLSAVAGSSEIAHRCYRDGIEWLIFGAGVDTRELKIFVDILNAHQIIKDENEGDIVTSLWESELSRIQYYTNDAIWSSEPLLDLARFRVQSLPEEVESSSGAAKETPQARSILDSSTEKHLWQLTQEEIEKTRQMVFEEENRDPLEDIFDVLLVILEQQRTREDVTTALDIIQESLAKALARGYFQNIYGFLSQFHRIRRIYAKEGHWVLAHLDDFLHMISGSRILSSLQEYVYQREASDPEQLENMRKTLIQLLPDSIEAIVPMLSGVRSNRVKKPLYSAIRELAGRDIRPLARMARNANPDIAKEAISILSTMSDDRVTPFLLEVTRSPDSSVRRAAVEGLTRQEATEYNQIIPFLADKDVGVRRLVLRFFSQKRLKNAESSIKEYIRQSDFKREDAPFLRSLYRALGNCASQRSQDFLRERLFSSPASMGGMRAVHRHGAAVALRLLGGSEANDLLRKASHTLWPSVRRAARKAQEQNDAE